MSDVATPLGKRGLASRLGLDAAAAELRTNPRARLGLIALAVVLLLAGGLRVASHVAQRNSEIIGLESRVRDLNELIGPASAQWASAQEQVSVLAAESRAMLWSEAPVGIAQADFLNYIQKTAETSGLTTPNVRIGEVRRVGDNSNLVEIRVSLYAGLNTQSTISREIAFQFLRTLSTDRRLVLTRNLRLRFIQPMVLEGEFATFIKEGSPDRGP